MLQIIITENCTAKDLWDNIEKFFLDNKMARALQLHEIFHNTKKDDMNITDYYHHLKFFVDALKDVDAPISETELVMQILHQLPSSYSSLVDIITNIVPFPTFFKAKTMLLVHESRENQIESLSEPPFNSSTALYANVSNNDNNKKKSRNNRN